MNYLFCIISGLIVFLFYAHTLSYEWKFFDEDIIYNEIILPISKSFLDLTDIVSSIGLKNHFEASNPFYSNISNLRGTPFSNLVTLAIFWLFKKSSFNYHFFMLFLHIINSILCFLIIKNIFSLLNGNNKSLIYKNFIALIISLLWSLHPVNVESILFATNFGAIITYFFCISFIYIFVKIAWSDESLSLTRTCLLFLLYLIPLFLNEYSVTLPLITFSYCFFIKRLKNFSIKDSLITSLKNTTPFIFALLLYSIYFISSQAKFNVIPASATLTLERILWFSPQIFIHLVKLILSPLSLNIDQSGHLKYSFSLYDPYAMLCCSVVFLLLTTSFISIIFGNKKLGFLFNVTFLPMYFSLIPFLHILSPIYNIASERYLYFPSFLFVVGIAHIFPISLNSFKTISMASKVFIATGLSITLLIFSTKSYSRTQDWKDSITLLKSSVYNTENYLYKALREQMVFRVYKSLKNPSLNELLKGLSESTRFYIKRACLELQIKKDKYNPNVPKIIKYYGLDPNTLFAKAKFLEALIELDISGNTQKAYEIFEPYSKDILLPDTQITSFYYKVLFNTKNYNAAEKLLLYTLNKGKINPSIFVALSDLNEFKYNDLRKTEEYLLKSFSVFPYDPNTLFGLRRLYGKSMINNEKFAYFSWLFGLRMHSQISLKESALAYIALGKRNEARKVLKNLIKHYGADQETIELASGFERKFGNL